MARAWNSPVAASRRRRGRPRRPAGCRRRCCRAGRGAARRGRRGRRRSRRPGRCRRRAPCRGCRCPAPRPRGRRRRSCRCGRDRPGSRRRRTARCAGAELADAAQVAVRRDDHAALALDRLDEHGHRGGVDRGLHGREVAVGHRHEAGRERAEAVAGVGVVGEADDRGGAAVEVAGGDDDLGLVGGHALDLVAPLAGDLDRGLDGLGAGVHRQHQVLAAQVGEGGGEVGELVVHEGPAGQRQLVELGVRGGEQRRVAVAEVERGVAGQQVEEATSVDVGHPGALGVRDHHGQRVVVVRGALLGALELGPPQAGRVGLGWCWVAVMVSPPPS